jgi:hypothetical protein
VLLYGVTYDFGKGDRDGKRKLIDEEIATQIVPRGEITAERA